ncbi:MAG: family 43 glycosylhydrolase [Bacteroidales bacterium]|nr:family 43 glycosylhydrolase [Bacteroidales bacterium]
MEKKYLITAALSASMLMAACGGKKEAAVRNEAEVKTTPTVEIWLSDPAVLADAATQTYYMTGTSGRQWRSKDLKNWEGPFDVIDPDTTSWMGAKPMVWAAEPFKIDGKYYYFGTFTNEKSIIAENHNGKIPRRSCHILVADSPEGPFRPIGNELYVSDKVPTLDATYFCDTDGKKYLLYCEEWLINDNGTVEAVELKDDLSGLKGEPQVLFRASDAPWNLKEDGKTHDAVTDGPFCFRTGTGRLGIFWTSWKQGVYTTGVAYSASGKMEGPWVQEAEPILPPDFGHAMLFQDLQGKWMMSVHHTKSIEGGRMERHPYFFDVDLSGDKLVVVLP